jgi:hypothetical protein
MSVDNDTNPAEDTLKRALRRQDAPDGFADRILARAAEQNSAESRREHRDSWWRVFAQPAVRWATVPALAAALVTSGLHYRQVQYDKAERERAQGEAAKQRLMLGLRIASSKLQLARSKVNEINAEQTANHEEKE